MGKKIRIKVGDLIVDELGHTGRIVSIDHKARKVKFYLFKSNRYGDLDMKNLKINLKDGIMKKIPDHVIDWWRRLR